MCNVGRRLFCESNVCPNFILEGLYNSIKMMQNLPLPPPQRSPNIGQTLSRSKGAGVPDVTVSESAVDRTVEVGVRERLLSIPNWRGFNNPWMPIDEADVEYSYINLKQNPERYTGYKVHHVPCIML